MFYDTFLKRLMGLATVVILYGPVTAQTTEELEIPSIESFIETENLLPPMDMHLTFGTSTKSGKPSVDASRSVYIMQIGNRNHSRTNIGASNSATTLLQNGDGNRSDIRVSGKTVFHTILQNGNENTFLEYGRTPNLNLERNIMQDGNDHSIAIFGSNSLTESMTLKLKGNSEAVTIRNFN